MIGIVFVLLLFAGTSTSEKAIRSLDWNKQSVVAERKNSVGGRTIIAVDENDFVHEISSNDSGDRSPAILAANLGQRVLKSGRLDLNKAIPKGEVPTAAQRVRLNDKTTIHVVLAWGFLDSGDVLAPYCRIHVLREQNSQVQELDTELLGTDLEQFIVEDLTHDGVAEVLVTSSEAELEAMDIWQIQKSGDVKKIQRITGYHVYTQSEKHLSEEPTILVETKAVGGAGCSSIREYKWSSAKRKFVRAND